MLSSTDIPITNPFGLRPKRTRYQAFPPGLGKNILRSGKVKYFFPGEASNRIRTARQNVKKILDCASTTDKEKIRPGGKDVYLKESFIRVPGQEDGYSLSLLDAIFLEQTLKTIKRLRKGKPYLNNPKLQVIFGGAITVRRILVPPMG